MSGICLAVALSSIVLARFPDRITLAWEHTVEKTRWEEDYVVEDLHLILTEARIRGTGAGMEIPPDAVFADRIWHYRPRLSPLSAIVITNSRLPMGYDVCFSRRCVRMGEIIGDETRLLEIRVCGAGDASVVRPDGSGERSFKDTKSQTPMTNSD